MADPQVQVGGGGTADQDDVEMQGGDEGPEVGETVGEEGDAAEEDKPAQRVTFIEYDLLLTFPDQLIAITSLLLTRSTQLPQIPHDRAPHRQRRRSNPPDGA